MSTPKARKAIVSFFKFCESIHGGPVIYNEKTNMILLGTSRIRKLVWQFAAITVYSILIIDYVIFFLVQLFSKEPPYGAALTIISTGFVCGIIGMGSFSFLCVIRLEEVIYAGNFYLALDRKLRRKNITTCRLIFKISSV